MTVICYPVWAPDENNERRTQEGKSGFAMGYSLSSKNLERNPVRLFRLWFRLAESKAGKPPNAMCLSTASRAGKPSARIVLLKEFDEHGFVFYTSFESSKGAEIEHNPNVALRFCWKELDRQVRIEGRARKISAEEADRYFYRAFYLERNGKSREASGGEKLVGQ